MTMQRLGTLKQFVEANRLLDDVVEGHELELVKLEAALFYFELNREVILKLDAEYRSLILSLIDEKDYVVDGSRIRIGEVELDINDILQFVNKIEEIGKFLKNGKIIKVDFGRKADTNFKEEFKFSNVRNIKNNRVVDISQLVVANRFTKEERAYFLEGGLVVDEKTIPFILGNRENFKREINKLIINLINGTYYREDNIYFSWLIIYLRMYPFLEYGEGLFDFGILDIPQNAIGVPRFKVDDEYSKETEEQLRKLEEEREHLRKKKNFVECYMGMKSKQYASIQAQLREIEIEMQSYSYAYFTYIHSASIYNCNLLKYMVESFKQGNVFTLDENKNGIVKMFYINDDKVDFFGAMRMEVLSKLIDANKLMDSLDKGKALEKK